MRNRYKAMVVGLGLVSLGLFSGSDHAEATSVQAYKEMYRVYNQNSGEHFYTADVNEKNILVSKGWTYEGIGWNAPMSGDEVYRMYNSNAGDHHYTTNAAEKDYLVSVGWNYEGVGWYSDTEQTVPLYRAYNPNAVAGSHNYTVYDTEQTQLIGAGWTHEGIAWYGVKVTDNPTPTPDPTPDPTPTPDEGIPLGEVREGVDAAVAAINAYRAENGLAAVKYDQELTNAAMVRAKELTQSFSHTRPDGTSCSTAYVGGALKFQSEICTSPYLPYYQNPEERFVVMANNALYNFKNSSSHNALLLNEKSTHVGIGFYNDGKRIYTSWLFARE